MKADAAVSWPRQVWARWGAGWQTVTGPIRRFPHRLRERRFWEVQVLVLVATVPHYAIETLGYKNPAETLHGLAITVYIVPLLYAALSYGWEGAALTGLWSATLTSPSIWIWHRSGYHWFAELGQLGVTLPVGILVAWRVDLESKQRKRAETTSASLQLLNEVGEVLSHTLEVEQQIPQVLRRLLSGLSLESAWLYLLPASGSGPPTVAEVSDPHSPSPAQLAPDLHQRIVSGREQLLVDRQTIALPLVGETGILGSLGVTAPAGQEPTDELVGLLTTVGRQVTVALENARLYRERQESLQSYVRQVTQAQEEERLRIARDLHDETAQELVRLVRKLEQLRKAPNETQSVDELLQLTRDILQAVRRYSRDLRPSVLDDLGLVPAIEILIEESSGRLPGGAQLQVTGKPCRLDGPVELSLFRITQEALRNVEKHAGATTAVVELDFGAPEIRLSVSDDGAGFSPPANVADLSRAGKLGVLGMKERAELVGGRFELTARPGAGTRVTVAVNRPDPHRPEPGGASTRSAPRRW
ncbi:MAG TPA: sensor histidine kinase [Dehalococcoidia bacterium]|nr:sensor histidine kinase [Dehalococcoidia bacterium]